MGSILSEAGYKMYGARTSERKPLQRPYCETLAIADKWRSESSRTQYVQEPVGIAKKITVSPYNSSGHPLAMIHLFVDASAASSGSGPTYVRNVVPHLAARTDLRSTILVSPLLRQEFQDQSNTSPMCRFLSSPTNL